MSTRHITTTPTRSMTTRPMATKTTRALTTRRMATKTTLSTTTRHTLIQAQWTVTTPTTTLRSPMYCPVSSQIPSSTWSITNGPLPISIRAFRLMTRISQEFPMPAEIMMRCTQIQIQVPLSAILTRFSCSRMTTAMYQISW